MRLLNNDKGSVMIMVAIAMMVFLGFSALVVDGGYLYFKKTQLQGVADAAALAAGKEYDGTNQSLARQKAIDYAQRNSLTITPSDAHDATIENANGEIGYMDVTFPGNNVKVIMNLTCYNFFAKILGSDSSDVGVSATVGTGVLSSFGRGILPLGVEEGDFQTDTDEPYKLSDGPGDGYHGNYKFLNLDSYLPPGSTDIQTNGSKENFDIYLAGGYSGDNLCIGGTLKTHTGQGQISNVSKMIGKAVTLPLIKPFSETNPHGTSDRIEIVGFVEFYIEEYVSEGSERYIIGRFLRKIEVGPIDPSSTSYTVRAVRLID